MEDETIVDKEVIIISNNKSHIIIPNSFVVGYHECELRYCSCTYNEKNCFFNGNVFSWHRKSFSKWWYQDRFDKITVQADTFPELRHKNRN